MAEQVKYSFDNESLKKMLKGAFYAVVPAAAIALLTFVGTISISSPILATAVVWAVPFLINVVKEWASGK